MENIKNRYKSKSYYKSITEIAYTPVHIYDKQYLVHKKGEVETTKFLGITFYKKVFDDDIYSLNGDEYTKSEIINSQAIPKFINDGVVGKKAEVKVTLKDNVKEYFYFDSNEKAKEFIEDLITECKLCGNEIY